MNKILTYDEFIELAKENYYNGGDQYYECLDRKTYEGDLAYWGCTREEALKKFSVTKELQDEYKAAARWYGGEF